MKRTLALLTLLAPGFAGAYPIDLSVINQGLDFTAEAVEHGGATMVHLVNYTASQLRCEVDFRAGPQTRRRIAVLESKASETVRYSPPRAVVRMRVRVECRVRAAEEGDSG